ncbi:hypothetical protein SELMODRAFT_432217 [Selaginella moellendorffii]|uniref:Uncharacterized protein n=1 Tax=Selaginella moellendorffii TaxID=88036 RepID=D8TFB6_SELML|nr:hypothetical protein SELMODRAFT_432217 [Selaginella moellendorffii]
MLKVMHKFGIPPHRVKVYIVTTSELYPAAGYQNWRKSRNLVLRDERILRRLVGITQYVLDSGVSRSRKSIILDEETAELPKPQSEHTSVIPNVFGTPLPVAQQSPR